MKRMLIIALTVFSLLTTVLCAILIANKASINRELLSLSDKIIELENINSSQQTEILQLNHDIDLLQKENDQLIIDAEEVHIITKNYNKAMSEWSGRTGEGVSIIVSYAELWKNEMDNYYDLLYDKLKDEKKQFLILSQEKWELFTKDNEELAWQTYDQLNHGGSIMKIYTAQIYLERYRSRALTLKSLYDFLTRYKENNHKLNHAKRGSL